jgi:hypothetical protein
MPSATTAPHSMTDVSYWRARAEETRATADTFSDPESRGIMLDIADGYDSVADVAERLLQRDASND